MERLQRKLGISEFVEIYYELSSLLQQSDLSDLDEPFSKEEIDAAVKEMPSSHAPGPDGFNVFFMKKCWHIISEDLYKLYQQFYDNLVNLTPINGSYITLIPKSESPRTVNDFRPISLLNYSLKLLTKILANRLQKVILTLVHTNHYGFIKGRSIQD